MRRIDVNDIMKIYLNQRRYTVGRVRRLVVRFVDLRVREVLLAVLFFARGRFRRTVRRGFLAADDVVDDRLRLIIFFSFSILPTASESSILLYNTHI